MAKDIDPDFHFRFRSDAFNTSEPREHFINPGCFDGDAAQWLIAELRARGVDVDGEPAQEDFGWYVRFRREGVSYCLILGLVPGDEHEPPTWAGWFERDVGFVASLFGGRKRGIASEAVRPVRQILDAAGNVQLVQWSPPSG